MQFLRFRSFPSPQPNRQSNRQPSPQRRSSSDDVSPLRQLLSQGIKHPAGSLDRQRLFSQLMLQMQASGKIWSGSGVDPDHYAEVLASQWLQLCQSPECFLQDSDGVIEQFNQNLHSSI